MDNIFEEAGRAWREKNKNHKSDSSAAKKQAKPKKTLYSNEDARMAEMMQRMHEMKRDIDNRLMHLLEQAKRANIADIDRFMNARIHLFAQDFEKIQDIQKQIKQLQSTGPTTIQESGQPFTSTQKPSKTPEKMTQERKGKTRGARKKWIPIQ